jgi:hypothetical protein
MNDEFYLDTCQLSKEKSELDEHEEESYCNWEIKRNKKLLTVSPSVHSYINSVPYSESLAKELEERS